MKQLRLFIKCDVIFTGPTHAERGVKHNFERTEWRLWEYLWIFMFILKSTWKAVKYTFYTQSTYARTMDVKNSLVFFLLRNLLALSIIFYAHVRACVQILAWKVGSFPPSWMPQGKKTFERFLASGMFIPRKKLQRIYTDFLQFFSLHALRFFYINCNKFHL